MNQFYNVIWNFNPFTAMGENIGKFFMELLETLFNVSSDVCLIVGLIGAILYIFGYDKGKKYPLLAWGINLIIRVVGGVLLGI